MKKLSVLLAFLCLILISCSENEALTPAKQVLPKTSILNKVGKRTYKYNGNKISSIETLNQLFTFKYSGNLISEIFLKETGGPNELFTYKTVYDYDFKNRLVKDIIYNYTSSQAEKTVYTYNSNNTISFKIFFGDLTKQNGLHRTGVVYLNSNKEVIRKDYLYNGILREREEFTYDDKNSDFKNILGINKIFTLFGFPFGKGKVNNITKRRYVIYGQDGSELIDYVYNKEYTYNDENYPENVKIHTQNVVIEETIFY